MLRASVLSFVVLLGVALMLPLTNSSAHADHPAASHRGHHHSRAWWRRHRARLHRRRAAALQKQNMMPPASAAPNQTAAAISDQWSASPIVSYAHRGTYNDPRGLFNLTMPDNWSSQFAAPNGDIKFRVFANNQQTGQAMLSLVSTNSISGGNRGAEEGAMSRRSSRLLGGIALADLRRIVINKMISTGGWVVNDFEREIGGRRSFIVVAQTPASSDGHTPEQSWTFYFTEIDGRVYNLAMSALPQFSGQLAAQSEQLLASFHMGNHSTAAARR